MPGDPRSRHRTRVTSVSRAGALRLRLREPRARFEALPQHDVRVLTGLLRQSGMRQYPGSMIDEFDGLRNEAVEFIDAGDEVVVVSRISGPPSTWPVPRLAITTRARRDVRRPGTTPRPIAPSRRVPPRLPFSRMPSRRGAAPGLARAGRRVRPSPRRRAARGQAGTTRSREAAGARRGP